jgi:hypothetical protein
VQPGGPGGQGHTLHLEARADQRAHRGVAEVCVLLVVVVVKGYNLQSIQTFNVCVYL